MNKVKMKIWGRILDLDIIYDCYKDEEVLDSQRQSLNDFIKKEEIVNVSLPEIVKYCLADEKLSGQEEISNIFKYVMPKTIYIKRNQAIVLLCDYKLDFEHGLAISFQKGKLKEISEQGNL